MFNINETESNLSEQNLQKTASSRRSAKSSVKMTCADAPTRINRSFLSFLIQFVQHCSISDCLLFSSFQQATKNSEYPAFFFCLPPALSGIQSLIDFLSSFLDFLWTISAALGTDGYQNGTHWDYLFFNLMNYTWACTYYFVTINSVILPPLPLLPSPLFPMKVTHTYKSPYPEMHDHTYSWSHKLYPPRQ